MGLFDRKKTISVSSTVYNLAGDVDNRPNFLKTNVFSAVKMSTPTKYVGETIISNYLNGPGIKQRSFYRYANNNYPEYVPTSQVDYQQNIDPALIKDELDIITGEDVTIQKVFIDYTDPAYFAEKYILENYPELVDTNWLVDVDDDTNDITIQYEDASYETFTPTNFEIDKRYLIVYYNIVRDTYSDPVIEGTIVNNISNFSLVPSVVDYDLTNTVLGTNHTISLDETTEVNKVYSDGRPNEYTSNVVTSSDTFQDTYNEYTKEDYIGYDEDTISYLTNIYIINLWESYIIDTNIVVTETTEDFGSYTVTTTTTTTTESIIPNWDYREDTQVNYQYQQDNVYEMYIYKLGNGNTLFDSLVSVDTTSIGEFYPIIPIRVKNTAINQSTYLTDYYPDANKLFKKATGNNIDELLDNIEDNPNISDIDFCFIQYGVPLNTEDNSGKTYIYEFYKNLSSIQNTTYNAYADWLIELEEYFTQKDELTVWDAAQGTTNILSNTTRPELVYPEMPPVTTIVISCSSGILTNYKIKISWLTIKEENFTGIGLGDMTRNEVRIILDSVNDVEQLKSYNPIGFSSTDRLSIVKMYKQTGDNTYSVLTVIGMRHQNWVYANKTVRTSPEEALADPDESNFIVPMHYPTMLSISLVHSTQLTTVNSILLFNSYTITKQKWYQTVAFQVVLVIAVVAITIATAGAGAPSAGVLGTNVAVGTAAGFTGTAAIVAGFVINALAAIIITQILSYAAREILGDEIGNVVGAILSLVVTMGLSSYNATGSVGLNWGELAKAENLLKLTSALPSAINNWIASDTRNIITEINNNQEYYSTKLNEIEDLSKEFLNDPSLINVTNVLNNTNYPEDPQSFLTRTTMNSLDISELSLSMIYNYVKMNLELKL